MHARHYVATLVLALSLGCSAAPTASTPVDKAADEQSIRNIAVQWSAAIEKKDLDAIMAFYTQDATAAWPDSPAIHGLEAIRSGWTEVLKTPGLAVRFTPERIDVANAGDVAVDFGKI